MDEFSFVVKSGKRHVLKPAVISTMDVRVYVKTNLTSPVGCKFTGGQDTKQGPRASAFVFRAGCSSLQQAQTGDHLQPSRALSVRQVLGGCCETQDCKGRRRMCTHGVRFVAFLRFRTMSSSSGAGMRQRRMPASVFQQDSERQDVDACLYVCGRAR